MGHIIAFINQKGGVGKTTTAAGIGAGLRRKNFSILFIDADPQANLSYIVGADSRLTGTLELLTRSAEASELIQKTAQGDVISASAGLAAEGLLSDTGKEYRLRESLEAIKNDYDCILIDCPPSLGILAINALTAATAAILPVQADILSLQALGQFSQTLGAVRRYTNRELKLFGLVMTRYNKRTVLTQEATQLIEQTAAQLGTKVYKTPIRESIVVKEAQASKQDIFSHSPKSNSAADFAALTDEIIKDMEAL